MSNLNPTILLLFILFAITAISGTSIVFWSIKNGISPMPSSSKAKKAILEITPRCSGVIYELGFGWGTLLIPLALQNPEATVIGIESSPIPFYFTKMRILFKKIPNLELRKNNFFTQSLKDASLVLCYLYPAAMQRLKKKFENELLPGTIVISNTFSIPGWTPLKELHLADLYRSKIYMYRVVNKGTVYGDFKSS